MLRSLSAATQSAILIADIMAPATLLAIPLPSFATTGTPTYKLSQVETPRRAETDRGRCRLVGKLAKCSSREVDPKRNIRSGAISWNANFSKSISRMEASSIRRSLISNRDVTSDCRIFAQTPIAAVMDWFFREVWKS